MKQRSFPKRRRSAAEIHALLKRYDQSNATQSEFARDEGMCLATLGRYLRRRESALAEGGSALSAGFVEVEADVRALAGMSPMPFRVWIGERLSVEIHPGFCSAETGRLLHLVAAMRAP